MAQAAGRRAASEYLRQLLLKPGSYRLAWQKHVVRARHDAINQLAVAEVLARHLSAASGGPGAGWSGTDVMPHQLKDTVSRALSGRLLSKPALELFIDAFGFTDDEADRLWRLWNGSATISVLSGSRAVPVQAEQDLRQLLGPRRHQTVTLHDHLWVGADGRIARARTLQVIEATEAGVDRIPFLYDTSLLTVEIGQGCAGLSGELRQIGPDVFATDILLARTLGLGETITMEYSTTFRYPGDPGDPGEREYRRAVMARLENFDMRIEFHAERLPSRLWWATWDGMDGDVLTREVATLDSQHAAQRFMRSLHRIVVGFYWDW
jgi:hypothetical protein